MAKVDAHRITKEEYDEIPELTEEDFSRGTLHIGGKPVSVTEFRKAVGKIGRPRSDNPKKSVTLRLDADVITHFRRGGAGWQTRINATLRQAAHLSSPRKAAAALKSSPSRSRRTRG